jgi:hypothetical protein
VLGVPRALGPLPKEGHDRAGNQSRHEADHQQKDDVLHVSARPLLDSANVPPTAARIILRRRPVERNHEVDGRPGGDG